MCWWVADFMCWWVPDVLVVCGVCADFVLVCG